MLFNSLEFLLFFPLVTAAYFLCPHRFRWALLLAASYYFYMCWKAEYGLLLLASTLAGYGGGLCIGTLPQNDSRRHLCLTVSLGVNLAILFAFKYFNFFNDSFRTLFNHFNLFYGVPAFNVLLPVGISFYTFQTMSYLIDVYRGSQRPEAHFGKFALYVSFFPQLVAGPIERAARLLPQFSAVHHFRFDRMCSGLRLMLWGFFKKLVIADRLALFVNAVFDQPENWQGISYIVAGILFGWQIYCDFSGYSDIAIGAARVLGFDLMRNFNRPFISRSITEFWQRWHISLSTWLRDYLYLPLCGRSTSKRWWVISLLLVFMISGLWHGAAWTFIACGALHGTYLILEYLSFNTRRRWCEQTGLKKHPRFHRFINIASTLFLLFFGWIFFRAADIREAVHIIRNLPTGLPAWLNDVLHLRRAALAPVVVGHTLWELLIGVAAVMVMETVQLIHDRQGISEFLAERPVWCRWLIYYSLIMTILVFGRFEVVEFIYFQF